MSGEAVEVSSGDALQPFLLNESSVRGRMVRLHESLTAILHRHDYPEAASRLLAESLLVAAMLSGNLKQSGIFTLQARGNGPIPMLVVDAAHGGALRGFAEIDFSKESQLRPQANAKKLLGAGSLTIILDPGGGMQRYEGIVEMQEGGLAESVKGYFGQSQQLKTDMKLAIGQVEQPGDAKPGWVAAGMMIEQMPAEGGKAPSKKEEAEREEQWREASILMQTLKDDELLDIGMTPPHILHRLYHESGVWVFDPSPFTDQCRCSRERIEAVLAQQSEEDLAELVVDGKISVHCQFCNRDHEFSPEEIKRSSK